MAYLLDSNTFIEARRRYYGMDFCPAYWDWLDSAHAAGTVYSIDHVAVELLAGGDELVPWVKARRAAFFLQPDQAVLTSLSAISTWATAGNYQPSAVTTFLQAADSYLVAHAHAYGHTVVTHETVDNSPKRVKIPNACVQMNVPYMNTFEMLRVEQARFRV
jgi:predicted nucleic acid-binding protein